jgi:hypothetical protein
MNTSFVACALSATTGTATLALIVEVILYFR